MQCPKCLQENFKTDKPCAYCGFQGNSHRIEELNNLQWLFNEMEKWGDLNIDAATITKLKSAYSSRINDTLVALDLRMPDLSPVEVEKLWVEIEHFELLLDKAQEWRESGFLNEEMALTLDPVKTQRAHADELRKRVKDYPRPEMKQTNESRLKTAAFLLDQIDLIASREWFKSRLELEKALAPILAMMIDAYSDSSTS